MKVSGILEASFPGPDALGADPPPHPSLPTGLPASGPSTGTRAAASLCRHPWVPLAHISSQLMEALYFLMGGGGDGVLLDLEWVIFKKLIICIIFHVAL